MIKTERNRKGDRKIKAEKNRNIKVVTI